MQVYDQRSETLDISDFITGALNNSEILLTDCTDIANWAIYAVTSAVKGS